MAVKKSSATKVKASKKAASPKKAATKTKAPKAKVGGAKAATKATKKTAPAKAKKAPVKLTDKQTEFLKSIKGTGEAGYAHSKKGEAKSLDSLRDKKLVKKGAKNKETGHVHYHVTKAGEKHLSSAATTAPSNGQSTAPSA